MKQTQRIGRYTAALTLVAVGAALLADLLLGGQFFTRWLLRLWPLMLVGLGVEYLIRVDQARRHPDRNVRFRPDYGALLLVLLALVLAVGTSIRPRIVGEELHRIPADGVEQVQIDLPVGALEVRTGSTGEIRVQSAVLSLLPLISDPSDAVDLQITRGAVVSVRAQLPRPSRFGVRLVVVVPPGLKLKATVGTGNMIVADYQGPLELQVNVGTIRVKEFRGGLTAETRTGQVRAETTVPLEEGVHLKTETGQIQLTVPASSSMQVTAVTRTGSLRLPGFVTIVREASGASGEGSTGGGEYPVTLEAGTGSITMRTR